MTAPIQGQGPLVGPISRGPQRLEADVTLRATDRSVHVDGDVFIGNRVLPTALRRALQGNPDYRNVSMRYQPDSQRFVINGESKFAGIFWDFSGGAKIDMVGHDLVMRDVHLDFPGSGFDWLENKARDSIVSGLNAQGIRATRQGADIRIDGSSLLRQGGVLPPWANLSQDTAGTITPDAEGNLAVHFGDGPTGAPDGVSRFRGHFDPAASQRVLQAAMGPKYHLDEATFRNGSVTLHGTTALTGLQSAINGAAIVVAGLSGDISLLLGGNLPLNTAPRVPLDLTIRPDHGDVVIKPDLSSAVAPIAKELAAGGTPVTTGNGEVRIGADHLLPNGHIETMSLSEKGMDVSGHADLSGLVGP